MVGAFAVGRVSLHRGGFFVHRRTLNTTRIVTAQGFTKDVITEGTGASPSTGQTVIFSLMFLFIIR